ncbi:hypothetical protein [Absidia glauca]|uniref:Ndc10 domain-containing protein n=1 Tax=Absidia glauca TaxID=4829 RepID=A0A168Q678_ABSGL|nr:hypothetical protein [Absidia glauca]
MEQHNDKTAHISPNLPRELVRSMAGLPINPPTNLCKKLFLAIGEWHGRLAEKEPIPGNPIQPTVAENAFVQVIMMFRKTFIQDSVLMMELYPCYPIWQHSIFSDPAYLSFKGQFSIIARECSSMLALKCEGSDAN